MSDPEVVSGVVALFDAVVSVGDAEILELESPMVQL